ncbi:agmatine/peptidylarginine deiminase [Aquiflexum sp.]|uniref:agmatine deiminase family protein n=1 Tax=Aquiflexum sp. TaxID=1872584 RepID=UPI003593D0C7
MIGLTLYVSCKQEPKTDPTAFYMPGEFEPHEAVWFGTWYMGEWASDYKRVMTDVMKAIDGHVQIKMASPSDSIIQIEKRQMDSLGVDISRVQFYVMPGEAHWIRDHGAAFLINRQGELGAVDFEWNAYGSLDWSVLRDSTLIDSLTIYKEKIRNGKRAKVDSLMAESTGAKWIKSNLTIEGGSIEVNGKGVLIQCEAVTLQRNPGWTKEALEEEYKRTLGIKKVIWLPQGLAEDEHLTQFQLGKYITLGTGGHTDEFVRFADDRTILLAWLDEDEVDAHPLNRLNYERMNKNYEILKKSTDQNGKPFKIIKIPLPYIQERPIVVSDSISDDHHVSLKSFAYENRDKVKEGDTLVSVAAASYLNFLVTNGVVVTASYAKDEASIKQEKEVEQLFQKAFPERKIVFIDAMILNWGGGGIHCSTQQEPKRRMK